MKTAYPFEPLWEAKVGGVLHQGKGLLAPFLWKMRGLLEEFSVVLPDGKLKAFPRLGVILHNGTRMADCEGPAELLWFRRMEAQIATHDGNSTLAPECLYYELGLKNANTVSLRVTPDLKWHRH